MGRRRPMGGVRWRLSGSGSSFLPFSCAELCVGLKSGSGPSGEQQEEIVYIAKLCSPPQKRRSSWFKRSEAKQIKKGGDARGWLARVIYSLLPPVSSAGPTSRTVAAKSLVTVGPGRHGA